MPDLPDPSKSPLVVTANGKGGKMEVVKMQELRRELGYSQLRLAREANIPLYRLQYWEQGLGTLADHELSAIETILAKKSESLRLRFMELIRQRPRRSARG
jgi:DNA-binding transcriptional regulator YiaG